MQCRLTKLNVLAKHAGYIGGRAAAQCQAMQLQKHVLSGFSRTSITSMSARRQCCVLSISLLVASLPIISDTDCFKHEKKCLLAALSSCCAHGAAYTELKSMQTDICWISSTFSNSLATRYPARKQNRLCRQRRRRFWLFVYNFQCMWELIDFELNLGGLK